MKINIVSQIKNGKEKPINSRGMEEKEVEMRDITYLSLDVKSRHIGIGKSRLYRLTKKSYALIKREFENRGSLFRFDLRQRV